MFFLYDQQVSCAILVESAGVCWETIMSLEDIIEPVGLHREITCLVF